MATDEIQGSIGFTGDQLERMVPSARREDVSSPEAIVKALHESVSGPKGAWNLDRLRSFCLPNVRFEFQEKHEDGSRALASITLDKMVKEFERLHQRASWYEAAEHVSVVKIERPESLKLASVSYTGREGTDLNLNPSTRPGSITDVMYIGNRWWIVSHLW